jgi:hypothetical protein
VRTSIEPQSPSASPPFEAAARFTRPLHGGAGAALFLAAVALGAQRLLGFGTLGPLALHAFLVAVVLHATGRAASLRRDVHIARQGSGSPSAGTAHPMSTDDLLELSGSVESARVLQQQRVRLEGREDTIRGQGVPRAQAQLERFCRETIAISFAIGGAAGLAASLLLGRAGLDAPPAGSLTVLVGLAIAFVAFLFLVASRAIAAIAPERLPESAGVAEWLRAGQ